eukprot:PITA_35087
MRQTTRMLTPPYIDNSSVLSYTRLDICFVVNILSQFMVELKRVHWTTVRHILRYMHGTIKYGLKYTQRDDVRLCGFTNVDWLGSVVDGKSTFGYCFNIGSGMVSWCSRKQRLVALSLTEAEYMATNTVTCEAIWLRKLLVSLFRDCVQGGAVQRQYVPTDEQVAEILTKALGRAKFVYFREEIGLVENPFQ